MAWAVPGPKGCAAVTLQLATPLPLVRAVQDCVPSLRVNVRPAMGVTPSSLSTPESVTVDPLRIGPVGPV